jgi:hypothetical protein
MSWLSQTGQQQARASPRSSSYWPTTVHDDRDRHAFHPTSGSRQAVIQEIAPDPAQALEAGIGLARTIAACGPLGIKTTLESAHLSIDESEAAAFAKLDEQFGGLFRTGDFIEGRKAEAQGRPPVYQGK